MIEQYKGQVMFVVKNTKSKKYWTKDKGWSANLFKAMLYDAKWVKEVETSEFLSATMGKNEKFVPVKMVIYETN